MLHAPAPVIAVDHDEADILDEEPATAAPVIEESKTKALIEEVCRRARGSARLTEQWPSDLIAFVGPGSRASTRLPRHPPCAEVAARRSSVGVEDSLILGDLLANSSRLRGRRRNGVRCWRQSAKLH